jgi:hypothetical protein
METRHVRFNFEEALNAKKQILTLELDILRMLKRIKAFRLFRKKELQTMNRTKVCITSLKSRVKTFLSTFPKAEVRRSERAAHHAEKPLITHRESFSGKLQDELEDIKQKLAELNREFG